MIREDVTLDDKYTLPSGRLYLSGIQALVRIPLLQRQLDTKAGLNTAGFISGYRGSPLGGYDMALEKAQKYLQQHHIKFQPGVNEDLGATAVWGSQQLNLGPGARYDGVFGIWYGKGPGVDRSTDAIKHANAAGTSKHGGVLALAGDDHACKSSTFPHQSEHAFVGCMVPVLNPAGIQDALDLGLQGIAMSRYSGCWTALKIVSDMADSSASVSTDPFSLPLRVPEDFRLPEGGLNIRWYDPPVDQERRLVEWKLPAAQAWARANGLDRIVWNGPARRLGIVSTGKAYMDLRQALAELGITQERAQQLGLSVYKVALVWPLEEEGIKSFARGLDEILVVEEKRGLIEEQISRILYNLPADARPRIVGKRDETGAPLLAEIYELSPAEIAAAVVARLRRHADTADLDNRLDVLTRHAQKPQQQGDYVRKPWYCSGCPHNTSTVVPEGSRALAGIGCHYMAMWMDRRTDMFTQMGGEGVPWIGQQPFSDEKHVFVNLGDGTYFHSGLLAIRAAVAAGVNITYKILYNDAVAMTGGQHVDGKLTVDGIARQVEAEGVRHIFVLSDEPWKYGKDAVFPPGTRIEHRDELEKVQKILRTLSGTSVLIYDQTCAAEKRRRRKRGLMEDPPKRVMINEIVCEGCGDCGQKSNCLSIVPVETEYGRKRQIDQSSCNKDFSCVKGFCPSFVTIHGGELKKPRSVTAAETPQEFASMTAPRLPVLSAPLAVLVTGIGGTGVVTIGAVLAMAAHLERKGATTMDQTGLAQKGGSVTSHLRLAKSPDDIHTTRIEAGGADIIIGCDLLVTADGDALSKIAQGRTAVVLNTHETPTGDFTRNPDWKIPGRNLTERIEHACGAEKLSTLDATFLATALLGDSIATNMFMVGYAWQKGLIPLSEAAILKAIDLNGVAVGMNKQAFLWGRRAVWNLDAVKTAAMPTVAAHPRANYRKPSETVQEMIDRRVRSLARYQNDRYARRYLDLVEKTRAREQQAAPGSTRLTEAVARYYYKVMAYKDEYEVARLYTDGTFMNHVQDTFQGDYKIRFHLAPPLLAPRDPETGHMKKMEFGPWMFQAFGVLAKMKFLRGTPLDIFGYTAERRMERRLIADYRATVEKILPALSANNVALAAEIAAIPEKIRGFGHVKEKNFKVAMAEQDALTQKFFAPSAPSAPAAPPSPQEQGRAAA